METPTVGRIEFEGKFLTPTEIKDGYKFLMQQEKGIRKCKDNALRCYLQTALDVARDMESCFETRLIIERLEDSLKIIDAA